MDRPENDNPLIERILSSSRPVVLVRGPACSGKTAAALGVYQRFVDDAGSARSLLIAPNAPAVSELRRKLLDASPAGVVARGEVGTFSALAARILSAAGDTSQTLSAFRRRVLLRRIVDELAAQGKLSAFRSVVDTPGLVVAIDRAIAELKRAAVPPEALALAVGRAPGRSRDLLEVYHRYQTALIEAGTYDVEGQMWEAREVLSAAPSDRPPPGLDSIAAAVADGFTDFTPTQLAILRELGRRFERVLITLPFADDGREKVWYWTGRTLHRIRETFGEKLEEIETAPRPTAMRALWDKVFDIDASPADLPGELQLIAAPSVEEEVAAVAREIKRELGSGGAPERIAVLARSPDEYRPAIERIFPVHDIPLARSPVPLTDAPIVRFVLDVAGVAPRCTFRDVLRVIGNSYFRPQALGAYGPDEVAAAQMLIREGNVLAGRSSYAEAGERIVRRARENSDEDDEDLQLGPVRTSPAILRAASEMLQKLFDLAEGASDAEGIARLVDALQLRLAACEGGEAEQIARDLRALAALDEALRSPGEGLATLAHLREALGVVNCPSARTESLVDVLDVLDARALRYDRVFLLGLSEGQFPRRFVESSLISEADRQAWARCGVALDQRGDLTAREMLLFYLAVSRADKALSVSFLESDAAGRARAAGGFLLSLLAPFGGLESADREGRVRRISPGSFVRTGDEIASPRDALNAALVNLFNRPIPGGAGALGWAVENAHPQILRAARGLLARRHRYTRGECDQYDGRITDPELLRRLGERFPGETVFSAGRLNAYGRCPWWFFAESVLKLRPLAVPQRRLEAVERGLFVHDVLFDVMSHLRDEADGSFRLGDVERAHLSEVLDEAVKRRSAAVEGRRPPYPALWKVQREQMRGQIRDYLLDRCERDAEVAHLHFELGFGLDDVDPELLDPTSRTDPITIHTPAGEVRIRGKIDRVDRVEGETGGLLVIDYKTGRLPSHSDIAAGRNLQLPVYTEAAEQILGASALGGVFHQVIDRTERHFSAVRPPRGDKRAFEQRRLAARAKIAELVAGMGRGRFDAFPTHDCPPYCPYRQICHYSPARVELKAPPDDEDREVSP